MMRPEVIKFRRIHRRGFIQIVPINLLLRPVVVPTAKNDTHGYDVPPPNWTI